MEEEKSSPQKKYVLPDHRQVGKRFIPPMLQIGPWKDAAWISRILPELIWIGLLNACHGNRMGADLALSLVGAALDASAENPTGSITQWPLPKWDNPPKEWFARASAYKTLSPEHRTGVIKRLEDAHKLTDTQIALSPLAKFYPESPFAFLFEGEPAISGGFDLEEFKALVSSLFDREGSSATFAMATGVYLAFLTNKIKVFEGLTLAKFPKIEDYPQTEESRFVAAGIRTCVFVLDETEADDNSWPTYFWNRGLALEPCALTRIYESYEY